MVMARRRINGFTLLELMVTIAIAAILISLALPSFQEVLRSNRVSTATNELLASLSMARSEAIRDAGSAGVCASSDGASCGADWNAGWLIWTDVGNTGLGTFESGDTIVRYSQGKAQVLINPTGGVAAFNFDNRGRMSARNSTGGLLANQARVVGIQPEQCESGSELVRTLDINMAGQITVTRGNCT